MVKSLVIKNTKNLKIIVIHQAPEGNVQKFVEANGDWMATHRVDLSTMEESSWTASLTKDSCCD